MQYFHHHTQVNETNKKQVDLWIEAHPCGFQVSSFGQDVLEILKLVWTGSDRQELVRFY